MYSNIGTYRDMFAPPNKKRNQNCVVVQGRGKKRQREEVNGPRSREKNIIQNSPNKGKHAGKIPGNCCQRGKVGQVFISTQNADSNVDENLALQKQIQNET